MSSRTVTYIRWIDSVMQHAQVGAHELCKPVVMESVGFVVAEGEDYVTLARDIDADNDMRGVLSVPKICIQTRENLNVIRAEATA